MAFVLEVLSFDANFFRLRGRFKLGNSQCLKGYYFDIEALLVEYSYKHDRHFERTILTDE